jgi:hypothetical protein
VFTHARKLGLDEGHRVKEEGFELSFGSARRTGSSLRTRARRAATLAPSKGRLICSVAAVSRITVRRLPQTSLAMPKPFRPHWGEAFPCPRL